jgi:hypothetical protein
MDNSDHYVWRPAEWLKAANYPFSRPTLYAEIRAGRIDARKCGRATIITTSPRDYFMRLPQGIGPPIGRNRRTAAVA